MASIEESVTAMIPAMAAEIATKIKEQTLRQMEHTTSLAIADAVKAYVTENVLPLVHKELAAQTDEIKAAVLAAARGIAEQLTRAMVDQVARKLASYEGEKLMTAVFGPLFRGTEVATDTMGPDLAELLRGYVTDWIARSAPRIRDEMCVAKLEIRLQMPQGEEDGTLYLDYAIDETITADSAGGRVTGLRFNGGSR